MTAILFLAALVYSSLLEYWVHRLAHQGWLFKDAHWSHHTSNRTEGFLWEYLYGSRLVLMYFGWPGFVFGVGAGLVFLSGVMTYLAFAVYTHELLHTHPEQVFWMPCPVHTLHHRHQRGEDNFGVATDVWDRVFGTYAAAAGAPVRGRVSVRKLLGIKWY